MIMYFRSGTNAVTPRPNWPQENDIPPSTTPPVSPDEHGAVDFQYWNNVGYNMLITSNINNW